jgi:hypothetical protein
MPKCQICGNVKCFGASKLPPSAKCANGPISDMLGQFNQQKELMHIVSSGVDKAIINAATRQPQDFFDLCVYCGHESVVWDEGTIT